MLKLADGIQQKKKKKRVACRCGGWIHPTFLAVVVCRRFRARAISECARVCISMRAYVRACLSFFRNRRRVGGAKLEDAEEGRRPVINGTRETAFLESLLVLLFAAQRRPLRDEWANERTRLVRKPPTLALEGAKKEEIDSVIPNRAIEFEVQCKDRKGRTQEFKGNRRGSAFFIFLRDKETLE